MSLAFRMVRITPDISIPDEEVRLSFVRSSGPGGQNVNKVSSAVELRFDAGHSSVLAEDVKQRLAKLAGSRMTAGGELIIAASRHRTQKANRDDAVARLVDLIRRAVRRPKPRVPTGPTRAARQRRLEGKKLRGQTKRLRRGPEASP